MQTWPQKDSTGRLGTSGGLYGGKLGFGALFLSQMGPRGGLTGSAEQAVRCNVTVAQHQSLGHREVQELMIWVFN